ncbi:hypothetical protein EVAR_59175_1 [Eumeta japonica]|uniref:Uncharacterized protein n=1 Tax=Eumeta variegata TaxID=151549 RepID=A0A4C1ZHH2_EUMVA|nr:hypothetical protein EVAR_59175_1 [Eumeta japonica]
MENIWRIAKRRSTGGRGRECRRGCGCGRGRAGGAVCVASPAGNRTPVSRVKRGGADHYTTENFKIGLENQSLL